MKKKEEVGVWFSGLSTSPFGRGNGRISLFVILSIGLLLRVEGKQTSYACEGSMLRLDCDPGLVIHLIRAIYGRFSITICNENGNTDWSVNCGSPKSILVLNGTCNYQRSCSVLASTRTFGDPCPGTVKYLEVQYQCISEKSIGTTSRSTPIGGSNPTNPKIDSPWQLAPPNDLSTTTLSTTTITTSTPAKGLILQDFLPFDINPSSLNDSSHHGHSHGLPFLENGDSAILNVLTSSSGGGTESHPGPDSPVPSFGSITTSSPLSNVQQSNSNVNAYQPMVPSYTDSEDEEDNGGGKTGSGFNMDVKWTDTGSDGEELVVKVRVSPTSSPPRLNSTTVLRPQESIPPGGNQVCESRLDRGMFWNWTPAGTTTRQPCPGGASGIARWSCVQMVYAQGPVWIPDSPDLSDCKSAWLGSLQARVLEPDQIPTILAGELAQVTSTKQMYGGDIGAAVRIMKALAYRKNEELRGLTSQMSREELAGELLQKILDAGSNLLEKSRLDPWRDLSFHDKMANATGLLVGLEDNAFLLANVLNSEKVLKKSSKNILTTIYAIETPNVREIQFPSESSWGSGESSSWARYGDRLTMPAEALRENSDGGLVRLVCFAYNNLEHVLQPIVGNENEYEESGRSSGGGVRKLVNSRVLSASLNQGRHIQLNLPVSLTFRHLWLDNVSNPQCVFWDYTLNAWSEEGCRVEHTNRTHTQCQCTHLTNFGILMDLAPPVRHSYQSPQMLQVVMYVGSAVVILCLGFSLLITHFCIHGKVFQTMILKNLFLCMLATELGFVIGLDETGSGWGCTSVALFLHYVSLASFLWLFLHGFHLYLIVVEAAESGLSRQLWYYGVSYGSPGIVVLLSFLLDPRGYRSEAHCWIHSHFSLLCWVGPALLVGLATAGMLCFTSYRVCGLLSALPKKPMNDETGLYVYAGTWLRGTLLILLFMSLAWTLRLVNLENRSSVGLSYGSSLALALQGIVILVFHVLKSEDMITKLCDCSGRQRASQSLTSSGPGLSGAGGTELEICHNNTQSLQHRALIDVGGGTGTLARNQPYHQQQQILQYHGQPVYSKGGPSPGGGGPRYGFNDPSSALGLLYSAGSRTYSAGHYGGHGHGGRGDPVYEEIERISPSRGSVCSDYSEDERESECRAQQQAHFQQLSHHYSHELADLYNRSLYSARGTPSHHPVLVPQLQTQHHHPHYAQSSSSTPLQNQSQTQNGVGTSGRRKKASHHYHPSNSSSSSNPLLQQSTNPRAGGVGRNPSTVNGGLLNHNPTLVPDDQFSQQKVHMV